MELLSDSSCECDSDQVEAAACLALLLLLEETKKKKWHRKKKRHRKYWVKLWINKRMCPVYNIVEALLPQLRAKDEACYKNFLRMTGADFDYILEKIEPRIEKSDTVMRQAIPAMTRFILTLRFLATGDSYQSLMYLFRIPTYTISRIIPEVLNAIYMELKDEYLKLPSSSQEWEEIATKFYSYWNFPNCIGALDGKHISIKASPKSGTLYFNYKLNYSIVLMAVADAAYKFVYINAGHPGKNADGGIFSLTSFGRDLRNENLNLPDDIPLPNRATPVPYCIIADDVFPLHKHIMKGFAWKTDQVTERVFNYRLSHSRRVVENTFGILTTRFRLLHHPLEVKPQTAISVVSTICLLHNFLMERSGRLYAPKNFVDHFDTVTSELVSGEWREEEINLLSLKSVPQRANDLAKTIQEEFADYFCENGEVPWQYASI